MKQPWLKFYPTDWRSDPALRVCSLAARGLWTEMLCVMHDAEPAGSLLLNGKPVTVRQIAAIVGASAKETESLIAELEEAGVFSRDEDGTIYSRRMRRDIAKAVRDKANGSGGGNPKLKKGVNPPDIPKDISQDNEEDKARASHKPEARSQKLEARISSSLRSEDAPAAACSDAELRSWLGSLVGQEPVALAQDHHRLTDLLDEGLTRADIEIGISEALTKGDPQRRFRNFGQFVGWARTAAKDRLARTARAPDAAPRPRAETLLEISRRTAAENAAAGRPH